MSRPWAFVFLVLSLLFTAVVTGVHVLSFRAAALDDPEITAVILVLFIIMVLLWVPAVSVVVGRAKAVRLVGGVPSSPSLLFRGTPKPVRLLVMAVLAYAFLTSVLQSFIFALPLNPAVPPSAVLLAFASLSSGILWGAARESALAA